MAPEDNLKAEETRHPRLATPQHAIDPHNHNLITTTHGFDKHMAGTEYFAFRHSFGSGHRTYGVNGRNKTPFHYSILVYSIHTRTL